MFNKTLQYNEQVNGFHLKTETHRQTDRQRESEREREREREEQEQEQEQEQEKTNFCRNYQNKININYLVFTCCNDPGAIL
jgi:predicted RNA polymerase sigma factor